MADYTRREEVKCSIIYSLPSPTNWIEVTKVISVIRGEMEAAGVTSKCDDYVTVEVSDDEIHFTFDAALLTGGRNG